MIHLYPQKECERYQKRVENNFSPHHFVKMMKKHIHNADKHRDTQPEPMEANEDHIAKRCVSIGFIAGAVIVGQTHQNQNLKRHGCFVP